MARSNTNSSDHRKLALIIGNGYYSQSCNRLRHSINNVNDLTVAVRSINFDVTQYIDVDHSMLEKIADFSQKIDDGDFVLFYFSGHVYSVNGKNFFIPIDDAQIKSDTDLNFKGFRIDQILARLAKKNPSGVTVLILDYERSYVMESSSKSSNAGLQRMPSLKNTFTQFAWDANQIGDHDQDAHRNSLYTKYLLKNIKKKNVNIGDMFQQIADEVQQESDGKQKPLSMNGLYEHLSVCFNEVSVAKTPGRSLLFRKRIAELPFRSPLTLNKQELIDADMEIIVEQAILGKQCIWLRLEENKITPDGISILVTAIQKKNALEGIGLFGNQLSDLGVQTLMLAISFSKNKIKSLGLGNNGITDTGIEYLANMLKANRAITQLCLQKNQITDRGIQRLLDAIEIYSAHIQELDLSGNMLVTDSSVDAFCNLIQHNKVLQQLWVYGCDLTPKGREQLVKTKKSRKQFDLRV